MGVAPGEGPATVIFSEDETPELDALGTWQRACTREILGGQQRRKVMVAEHEDRRGAAVRSWNKLGDGERRLAAQRAGVAREEFVELLRDPLLFAAAAPPIRARLLGALEAAPGTVNLDALPEGFQTTFDEAAEEAQLAADERSAMLLAGLRREGSRLHAELVGEPQRLDPLSKRTRWVRLFNERRR